MAPTIRKIENWLITIGLVLLAALLIVIAFTMGAFSADYRPWPRVEQIKPPGCPVWALRSCQRKEKVK